MRPFVNPAFTGPVILGSPTQWFNPAAFLAPPNGSGFYGNLGRDTLIGPGLATWDLSLPQGHADSRKAQSSVSRGVVQSPEPGQLQHAERHHLHADGSFAHGRRDHEHVDHIPADAIRTEAALVGGWGPAARGILRTGGASENPRARAVRPTDHRSRQRNAAQRTVQSGAALGPPAAMEEAWSDFRETSGVKIPYRTSIASNGQKLADVIVTDCKINSGLKLEEMQKRP